VVFFRKTRMEQSVGRAYHLDGDVDADKVEDPMEIFMIE